MGDIALTAAKVAVVDPMEAIIETYIAGEAITQGQFLYGIISSGKTAEVEVAQWLLEFAQQHDV